MRHCFAVLLLVLAGAGGPGFSQTWADLAAAEKQLDAEFKQKEAASAAQYEAKLAALNAEKIKDWETDAEFKTRMDKAKQDLRAERDESKKRLQQERQDRRSTPGYVVFTPEQIAVRVQPIDPETKTFPVVLTVGIAPASFDLKIQYSIKAEADIRTAYYRFADADKAQKIAAEVRCAVETLEAGKSYLLRPAGFTLSEKSAGYVFAAGTFGDQKTAVAWFGTLPPKSFETSGRVTVKTTDKTQAEVWIEDEKKGVTPLTLKGLAPGRYSITLKWPKTGAYDVTRYEEIGLGANPDIAEAKPSVQVVENEPASGSRNQSSGISLSDAERMKLRARLIRDYQDSTNKVGNHVVYSVERLSGFMVVSGSVTLNVVDSRGNVVTSFQRPFKVQL